MYAFKCGCPSHDEWKYCGVHDGKLICGNATTQRTLLEEKCQECKATELPEPAEQEKKIGSLTRDLRNVHIAESREE